MAMRLIGYAWSALLIVWIAGAVKVKPQVRVQQIGPRAIHAMLLLLAFGLIFAPLPALGLLNEPFATHSSSMDAIGLGCTLIGIAFAIWARFFLGSNWSATPSVKEEHSLIRSGPYAIVRHPIYSGLLLALLGTALTIGRWRALLGVAVTAFAWHFKSRTEERFMEEEFGSEYARYKTQVKGLIPFLL